MRGSLITVYAGVALLAIVATAAWWLTSWVGAVLVVVGYLVGGLDAIVFSVVRDDEEGVLVTPEEARAGIKAVRDAR